MTASSTPRLPLWKKIIFGTGDVYAGAGQQIVSFYYLFFLTDIVRLNAGLAGLVLLISRAWDAVSDPMMGVLSDRTKSRFGRRRPYFLAGTILVFLSFASLWLPVEMGTQLGKFIFALATYLFHISVLTMVLVPFYALGAELTTDYRERSSIMFFRLMISTISIILCVSLMPTIVGSFANVRTGYATMGIIYGLLCALPWWGMFFTFREKRAAGTRAAPRLSLRSQLAEPLRIKSFRQLMLFFVAGYVAIDLLSIVAVYYMNYYVRHIDVHTILGALLIGQVALLPIGLLLSRKIGKRNALLAAYGWWAVMLILMALLKPSSPNWLFMAVTFLMGGGVGSAAFLPWAIYPDVADVGELIYGARREGPFSGFLTFARKSSTAVASGLFGLALGLVGYREPLSQTVGGLQQLIPQPQTETVVNVIRAAMFGVPLLLLFVGACVATRFRLTPALHERIRRLLAFRRGEAADGDLPEHEVAAMRTLLVDRGKKGVPELLLFLSIMARAAVFLLLVPYALIRLAGFLSPWLPTFAPGIAGNTIGIAVTAAGAYLAVRAGMVLGCFGKEWPRRPTSLLVSDYIYSLIRHPLYLGYSLTLLGAGLLMGSTAMLLLVIAASGLLFAYARLFEEPALARRFGDGYLSYRQRTRFILPRRGRLFHGALSPNLVLLLAVILVRFLFYIFWRVKVEGQENVPEKGAHFLVCNHNNLADPFLVGMYLVRPLRFIATDELFRHPLMRILFGQFFGAFKKRRWSRDIAVLRRAERWLSQGEMVGIFPEGSRTWDGAPVAVGDEVYRFIHHCHVPVVTAAIIGGHEAMPRWSKWPACADVTIRFYPPIRPDECANAQQLRERIEKNIHAGQREEPSLRTRWHSHRGITTVAWACIKCGATKSMVETRAGVACRQCGAAWTVTRKLELVDDQTGRVLLERDYHRLIKERLAAGTLQGAGVIWARARAYRVDQLKLKPLGAGELSLDGKTLRFVNDGHWVTVQIDQVGFAYLNLPGHLVITDRKETLEFAFLDDSPVRWEDYVALARKDLTAGKTMEDKAATGKSI